MFSYKFWKRVRNFANNRLASFGYATCHYCKRRTYEMGSNASWTHEYGKVSLLNCSCGKSTRYIPGPGLMICVEEASNQVVFQKPSQPITEGSIK